MAGRCASRLQCIEGPRAPFARGWRHFSYVCPSPLVYIAHKGLSADILYRDGVRAAVPVLRIEGVSRQWPCVRPAASVRYALLPSGLPAYARSRPVGQSPGRSQGGNLSCLWSHHRLPKTGASCSPKQTWSCTDAHRCSNLVERNYQLRRSGKSGHCSRPQRGLKGL